MLGLGVTQRCGFRGAQAGFNPAAAPLGLRAAGQEVSRAGAGSAGAHVPTCHPWKSVALAGARGLSSMHGSYIYIHICINIASLLRVTVATGFILLKPSLACDVVRKEQLNGSEVWGAGGEGLVGSSGDRTGDALELGLWSVSLGTVTSPSMSGLWSHLHHSCCCSVPLGKVLLGVQLPTFCWDSPGIPCCDTGLPN